MAAGRGREAGDLKAYFLSSCSGCSIVGYNSTGQRQRTLLLEEVPRMKAGLPPEASRLSANPHCLTLASAADSLVSNKLKFWPVAVADCFSSLHNLHLLNS